MANTTSMRITHRTISRMLGVLVLPIACSAALAIPAIASASADPFAFMDYFQTGVTPENSSISALPGGNAAPASQAGTPPVKSAAQGGTRGCTIVGTAGADRLVGTKGNDVICGLGGNDRIVGGGGHDRIYGGAGKDVIVARDHVRDVIDGGAGRDRATIDGRDKVTHVERKRR